MVSMAVFALVMAGVYTVAHFGFRARNERRAETLQSGRAALDALSADLRCAMTPGPEPAFKLSGDTASVTFFTLPQDSIRPRRVQYYIGRGAPACEGLCRKIEPEPFGSGAVAPEEEPVALRVAALEMSYFDGRSWLSHWDSDENLPRRIRISVTVRAESGDEKTFETEVAPPAAADHILAEVRRLK